MEVDVTNKKRKTKRKCEYLNKYIRICFIGEFKTNHNCFFFKTQNYIKYAKYSASNCLLFYSVQVQIPANVHHNVTTCEQYLTYVKTVRLD